MTGGKMETGEYFLVVGDVRPCGGACQGGTGGQMGDLETDQVRHVQHPEQTKQGSGISTSQGGAGMG